MIECQFMYIVCRGVLKCMERILISIMIFTIKLYQKSISPILPHVCRFYPTCSQYAIIVLKKHRIRGIPMVVYRLLKCNPYYHNHEV